MLALLLPRADGGGRRPRLLQEPAAFPSAAQHSAHNQECTCPQGIAARRSQCLNELLAQTGLFDGAGPRSARPGWSATIPDLSPRHLSPIYCRLLSPPGTPCWRQGYKTGCKRALEAATRGCRWARTQPSGADDDRQKGAAEHTRPAVSTALKESRSNRQACPWTACTLVINLLPFPPLQTNLLLFIPSLAFPPWALGACVLPAVLMRGKEINQNCTHATSR